MIILIIMARVMFGLVGIDRHAADGVLDGMSTIFMAVTGGSGPGHYVVSSFPPIQRLSGTMMMAIYQP